jgi:LAO/AO transport system kinase
LLTCGQTGEGVVELWDKIQEHHQLLEASSELEQRRSNRRQKEFLDAVEEELGRRLRELINRDPQLSAILRQVGQRAAEPYSAAMEFLDAYNFPQD